MKKQNKIIQRALFSLFTLFSVGALFAQNDPFITVWNTQSDGTSNNQEILVPAFGDWDYAWEKIGDPSINDTSSTSGGTVSGATTLSFPSSGDYHLKIYPNNNQSSPFNKIQFNNSDDRLKIIEIEQWGDVQWESFEKAFYGCANISSSASDAPDLTQVTNMSYMFAETLFLSGYNGNIGSWNVSNVTDMSNMFYSASYFDGDLGGWDVSNVIYMDSMFSKTLYNEDIGSWDVSNVVSMKYMFGAQNPLYGFAASEFNQDIGNWDVSSVTDMSYMFYASKFNQDIGNWDVSNVTDMSGMFNYTNSFNQDIGNWNVSSVTNMEGMFANTPVFNQYIGGWDVSSVTNMEDMFEDALVFNQDIGSWDVSSVTDMEHMFWDAPLFNQDIGNWDVSSVTDMFGIFYGAESFNQDIGNWELNVSPYGTSLGLSYSGSGMSCENYSRSIHGWANNPSIGTGITIKAGELEYSPNQTISNDRDYLINDLNWIFEDDSEGTCSVSLSTKKNTAKEFTVYPNPAQHQITIDGLQGKEIVQLTDMTGRVLKMERNNGASTFTLQIDELSNGVYNLIIQKTATPASEKGNQIVKKVIKR